MNTQHAPFSHLWEILLFFALLIFVLLYQLQLVAHWIADFKIRELLYTYLYLHLLLFYRPRFTTRVTPLLSLLLFFFGYSLFIAIHTYLVYGQTLAIQGFLRFVNVALLAPIAAILFRNMRQVKIFLIAWSIVVTIGAFTALYQFLGGDLSWLVQEFLATRGGLIRFNTILGEANVGGMAACILWIVAMVLIANWPLRIIFCISSIVLLILSVSKAALGGFILSSTLLLIDRPKPLLLKTALERMVIVGMMLLIFVSLLLKYESTLQERLGLYAVTALKSFSSSNEDSYGVVADLSDRLMGRTMQGIELAKHESDIYLLNVLSGSSFGIAGSVAEEMRGMNAILPHNSLAEIYFVGGLFQLGIFLTIIFMTCRVLTRRRKFDKIHQTLFIGYLMSIALLPTYPIIYEPIMGTFFWLTVGVCANSRLKCDERSAALSAKS
jgi:hypothetical protein